MATPIIKHYWPTLIGGVLDGDKASDHDVPRAAQRGVFMAMGADYPEYESIMDYRTNTYTERKIGMNGSMRLIIVWAAYELHDRNVARQVWNDLLEKAGI